MSLDPVLGWTLRATFALLFLSAALHKIRDLADFCRVLAGYEILPRSLLAPTALVLASAEAVIGFALLLPLPTSGPAVVGIGLLGAYAVAIAVPLSRGKPAVRCGCGGLAGDRPISPVLIVRNAVLIGLLALLLLPVGSRPRGLLDLSTTAFAVCAAVALFAAVDVALANAARLRALSADGVE